MNKVRNRNLLRCRHRALDCDAMSLSAIRVDALLIGKPAPFREDGATSAIARRIVTGPVHLGVNGLSGDEVADKAHHGGPDKALHLYPFDHYPFWRTRLNGHKLLMQPGAFGENISSRGLIESEARIGDRFRLGEALVEISHGRQPCWKLDHRFGVSGAQSVMATIVQTGRCGLYFRVIEPGKVCAGDMMRILARGELRWSVDHVFRLLVAGGYKDEPEALDELAALPALATTWRQRAAKLAG